MVNKLYINFYGYSEWNTAALLVLNMQNFKYFVPIKALHEFLNMYV